jgi:signal transduction histidine kinase
MYIQSCKYVTVGAVFEYHLNEVLLTGGRGMGTFDGRSHDRRHLQLLLRWRWLVLIVAIPISIVIELLEGQSEAFQFLDEVVIDGLVLPFSTWIVLTFAAQRIARQFEVEEALTQRQTFMQRLAEHRGYADLTHFVVHFPSTLLPVDHVSLFIFEPERKQFELAREWNGASSGGSPAARYQAGLMQCHACQTSEAARTNRIGACAARSQQGEASGQEYCLLFAHDGVPVGVLRLRCLAGSALSAKQIEVVNELAPEIARALALALADSRKAALAYREAQANERRRIAHELHDSLAQQVFYLHLGLDQLAGADTQVEGNAAHRKLETLRDVAAEVYEQIRHNLSILRTWEQVNLTEAVSDLARVTAHNAELTIDVSVRGEPHWLSPHTCEHLYGVVREGLHNIIKHAQARHIDLGLDWNSERLVISLVDDGVGFDTLQLQDEGHYGLTLMREAIEALQGDLAIDSRPGAGTHVLISIPLRPFERTSRPLQELPVQMPVL